MLFDTQHIGYLFVRLLFKHIKVENRPAPIGQICDKLHQLFFGNSPCLPSFRKVGDVRYLFLVYLQLTDPLLPSQVIQCLSHHHPGNPRSERSLATKRKVGEYFDETVMQYIVRRFHIARIAETYRQHLPRV